MGFETCCSDATCVEGAAVVKFTVHVVVSGVWSTTAVRCPGSEDNRGV